MAVVDEQELGKGGGGCTRAVAAAAREGRRALIRGGGTGSAIRPRVSLRACFVCSSTHRTGTQTSWSTH